MDQNQPELTLEESLKQVMQTLPPVIREYLTAGKYTPIARGLMTKYNLRIDQGGVLEREIMLLLMGVETPDEFTQALAEEAQINQQTISGIVQDINNQIFIPLRAEEERSSKVMNVPQSPRPVMPVREGGLTSLNQIREVSQTSPNPDRSQTSVNSNIAPLPPKTLMSAHASETLGDVVRSILPDSERKGVVNLLEKSKEPHLEFNTAPSAPMNLPGAMPPQSVPTIAKPISPAPAEPRLTIPPLQSYSSDPYREPVDEPLNEK